MNAKIINYVFDDERLQTILDLAWPAGFTSGQFMVSKIETYIIYRSKLFSVGICFL